jgi:hypothetical protein
MNIVLFLLVLKNMEIKISEIIVLPFFYMGIKQDLLSSGKNRYKKRLETDGGEYMWT